ncbi:hypothetical protein EDB83DRAFT_2233525, partial [Lactarius deliciosus]
FGITKRRFKVLAIAQEYPLRTQVQLVSALAVLHNFIHIYDPNDVTYDAEDRQANTDEPERGAVARDEQRRANDRRERIAKCMWDDYVRSGQCRR